jgi:drug/metabolite transporter (DMT)-like permease
MKTRALRADAMLLIVAAIWGSGFVAQKAAMDHMGPLAFTAIRYIIGTAMLALLFLQPARRKVITVRTVRAGALLGIIMAAAASAQQIGIVTTTASRAGFITGLYVLGVPAIGLLFGQKSHLGHLIGAVLAAAGLWLLAGDLSGGIRSGDLWVLLCAALWSVHVVLVAHLAPKADAIGLAFVQFLVVAVIATIFVAVASAGVLDPIGLGENFSWPSLALAKWPVLYSGIFAIGIAFTLQIIAQKDAPATHAAVLMSLEAVFAATFGVLLLAESLTRSELFGCGLMLTGMLLSQLWPHKRTPEEKAELSDAVR